MQTLIHNNLSIKISDSPRPKEGKEYTPLEKPGISIGTCVTIEVSSQSMNRSQEISFTTDSNFKLHSRSAIAYVGSLWMLVGQYLVVLDLHTLRNDRAILVDEGGCFGIYLRRQNNQGLIIIHGDTTIVAHTGCGSELWRFEPSDIVVEPPQFIDDKSKFCDFEERNYLLNLENGGLL